MFRNAINDTEELLGKYAAATKAPAAFNPEAIPARRRFLVRRIKLLKNLLRWRKFTGEQHGAGLLIARLTDKCILDIAGNGWDVGGEEIAKTVNTFTLQRRMLPFTDRPHLDQKYLTERPDHCPIAAEVKLFLTSLLLLLE